MQTDLGVKGRTEQPKKKPKKDLVQVRHALTQYVVGAPRKIDFEDKAYSPRSLDPNKDTPFLTQPVASLVAAYKGGAMQGVEPDGEANQRHNREAAAEEAAKQEKLKADYGANLASADKANKALDAALEASKAQSWQLMAADGELEPVENTKTSLFAKGSQIPQTAPAASADAASAAAPAADAAAAAAVPTRQASPKRKKQPIPHPQKGGKKMTTRWPKMRVTPTPPLKMSS